VINGSWIDCTQLPKGPVLTCHCNKKITSIQIYTLFCRWIYSYSVTSTARWLYLVSRDHEEGLNESYLPIYAVSLCTAYLCWFDTPPKDTPTLCSDIWLMTIDAGNWWNDECRSWRVWKVWYGVFMIYFKSQIVALLIYVLFALQHICDCCSLRLYPSALRNGQSSERWSYVICTVPACSWCRKVRRNWLFT